MTVTIAGDSFAKLINIKETLTSEMKEKGASLITDDVNQPQ
nr:hypothetical protein [Bacillus pumilus]